MRLNQLQITTAQRQAAVTAALREWLASDRQATPSHPSQRHGKLRHLPDPTRHQRVPAAELGRERNWKVADSDPGDERGLRMPAVDRAGRLGGALTARPMIAVKPLRGGLQDRTGWALKKEALRAGSSDSILSPAEYRQWMIRQEKAIDEFHAQYEANRHTRNCLNWREFWEQRGEPAGGI